MLTDQLTDEVGVSIVGDKPVLDAIRHRFLGMESSVHVDSADMSDRWPPTSVVRLPVRLLLGQVVIGPLLIPSESGCQQCFVHRYDRTRTNREGHGRLVSEHADAARAAAELWLSPDAAKLVADLLFHEVRRVRHDPGLARTRDRTLRVALDTLAVSRHVLVANPLCPACGNLPVDNAESARVVVSHETVKRPGTYRVRDIRAERDSLLSTFVDAEIGMIRQTRRSSSATLAVCTAPLGLRDGIEVENGFGRALDDESAELTAVLEALERHGGMSPGGRVTDVRGSWREVGDDALNPRRLGLHSAEQHGLRGFRYRPFTEDRELNWVWGYSFAQARPVLVPESYAYYGIGHNTGHVDSFVQEISNGCALGGCLEEAILHGVLEVVERDAFLMAWYGRLAVPEVAARSFPGSRVSLLAERIAHTTGYQVRLFDTTTELGLPAVWAVAENPRNDGRSATVSAAGAHFSSEVAAFNALCELAPMLDSMNFRMTTERGDAELLLGDDDMVRSMSDHALLHAHPGARPRLDFLLNGQEPRSAGDLFSPQTPVINGPDLGHDLIEVVRRFAAEAMDVIVVDQTTDEHRRADLHCVKVIIPGMLPMTFGHRYRRCDGFSRLTTVPPRLGHRAPGEEFGVNATPHPFP